MLFDRSRLRASRLAATLVVVGIASSVPAAADEKADARRFFDAAQTAFSEGRYVDAARAYEEAARIAPHPAPIINAGDAWQKAGEYAQAARAFQRVLKMKEASEQDRVDATDRLARLQPKLGIIELVGAASLKVRVGDVEFSGGERVYVFPGEHTVTLVGVEGAKVKTLDVAAGTARTVEIDGLRPSGGSSSEGGGQVGVDTTTPTEKGGISPVTWVAYGVGAAGLGAAAFFGLQANSAESDFNRAVDDGDRAKAESARGDFNDNKVLANVTAGIGLAGIATGTVLLIVGLSGDSSSKEKTARTRRGFRSADVGVTPLRSGGAVYASGRF